MLKKLAKKYTTNKLPFYWPIYEKEFFRRREDIKTLLEIGIEGGGSLKIWKNYFPNALIHGVDIQKKCMKEEAKRIKISIGDQADSKFLTTLGDYDIIIDDGGHMMEQQKTSFKHLFSHVNSGGVYVIEDLLTSYWPKFDGKLKNENTTVEMLKGLIDNLHAHWRQTHHKIRKFYPAEKPGYLDTHIDYMNIYDSIIFIGKK